ncbi:60S ribosomal protein L36 [Gregarina niphandrodes]|uniref:60S ribosomal protein L36 n=1 Tax=Gregarina niphandrodes TaxID=110365 RepID=A0A023B6P5_GRENI|nr:60S ribosomal protein L36 [Gregarina niphandrodes]EZG66666.1 60S ribosomal protein L36 [Gregarina niphandrodes]|eukprot:XP_011130537.1 60S ribosomal protein L36 [Gregarina niphandrodes]
MMCVAESKKKSRADRVPTFMVTKRDYKKAPVELKRSASQKLVHDVITEIAGFAPYEKRVIELLKVGTAATQKRALKVLKKRLGSHTAAKCKRDNLAEVVAAQKHHH